MLNPNTKEFWDEKIRKERKGLYNSPIFLNKNDIVATYLRGHVGKLLDVGIGYGLLEKLLIQKAPKLEIFGIDISTEAIKKMSKEIRGKFIIASVCKIPFTNNFFNFVIALDLLEHFRETELLKVLYEIKRVLKKNGIFIISVPLNESEKDKSENRHLTSFTESEIVALLKKYGFDIKKTATLYAFKRWYLIKTLVAKFFKLKTPNLIIVFCKKK